MTDAPPASRALRTTLIVGGVLLIVSAVVTYARTSFFSSPLSVVLGWCGIAAFSAALLVFAFGIGRGGSIVARRPLAVGAAVLVAVWPLVDRVATLVLPFGPRTAAFHQVWGYVSILVPLGGLIVFVVLVARAGVLRGRVRWMPLWGLVVVAAPQVLVQILVVALGVDLGVSEHDAIFLVLGVGQLAAFAVPVALGIVALVVANRPISAGDPVHVYPPAPEA